MGVTATANGGRRIRGLDADQRRAQRRDQLLTAAFELFAQLGYVNTSIEQICQTAYVGNKAFYELFESKEDCYLALMQETAARIEGLVEDELAAVPAGEPQSTTVQRVLSAMTHAFVDDPRVGVVAFRECTGISPRVESQRRANRGWAARFVESYWRSIAPAGTTVDYRVMAVAAVGGVFELIVDFLESGDTSRSIEDLIDDMTSFVLAVGNGLHLPLGTD